jgi:hypothetical protein
MDSWNATGEGLGVCSADTTGAYQTYTHGFGERILFGCC